MSEVPPPAPKREQSGDPERENRTGEVPPVVAHLAYSVVDKDFFKPDKKTVTDDQAEALKTKTTDDLSYEEVNAVSFESRQKFYEGDTRTFDERNRDWNNKLWNWVQKSTHEATTLPLRDERIHALNSLGIIHNDDYRNTSGLNATIENFRENYVSRENSDVKRFVTNIARGCANAEGIVDMDMLYTELTSVKELLNVYGLDNDVNLLVKDFAMTHGILTQSGEAKVKFAEDAKESLGKDLTPSENKRLTALARKRQLIIQAAQPAQPDQPPPATPPSPADGDHDQVRAQPTQPRPDVAQPHAEPPREQSVDKKTEIARHIAELVARAKTARPGTAIEQEINEITKSYLTEQEDKTGFQEAYNILHSDDPKYSEIDKEEAVKTLAGYEGQISELISDKDGRRYHALINEDMQSVMAFDNIDNFETALQEIKKFRDTVKIDPETDTRVNEIKEFLTANNMSGENVKFKIRVSKEENGEITFDFQPRIVPPEPSTTAGQETGGDELSARAEEIKNNAFTEEQWKNFGIESQENEEEHKTQQRGRDEYMATLQRLQEDMQKSSFRSNDLNKISQLLSLLNFTEKQITSKLNELIVDETGTKFYTIIFEKHPTSDQLDFDFTPDSKKAQART